LVPTISAMSPGCAARDDRPLRPLAFPDRADVTHREVGLPGERSKSRRLGLADHQRRAPANDRDRPELPDVTAELGARRSPAGVFVGREQPVAIARHQREELLALDRGVGALERVAREHAGDERTLRQPLRLVVTQRRALALELVLPSGEGHLR
jgi:hypothetical protein